MAEQCEYLETCGFFRNYRGTTEVIKEGWVRMYCDDREKAKQCERLKIREQTGHPPADSMCPTGKMLWG